MQPQTVFLIAAALFLFASVMSAANDQEWSTPILFIAGMACVIAGASVSEGASHRGDYVANQSAARTFKVAVEGFGQMGSLAAGSKPGSITLHGDNELVLSPSGNPSRSFRVNLLDSSITLSGGITADNSGWCFREVAPGKRVEVYNQDGLV